MKWLILFLFLFSDAFAQTDTCLEMPLMRSLNVINATGAERVDSNMAVMIPPHRENGIISHSELNFRTPRIIAKNERIAVYIIGVVPSTSDLLICSSMDFFNHWVVGRFFDSLTSNLTHSSRAYGWNGKTINCYQGDYSIISLIWDAGSSPYSLLDTVKIDAVYVYIYSAEDTIEPPIDSSVDTTVLLVRKSIELIPNGNDELGIWNSVGVSYGKKSVNSFVTFENIPDGLYFTSTAQWFMKKGKRYFWKKK